jgi:hypothetical protein
MPYVPVSPVVGRQMVKISCHETRPGGAAHWGIERVELSNETSLRCAEGEEHSAQGKLYGLQSRAQTGWKVCGNMRESVGDFNTWPALCSREACAQSIAPPAGVWHSVRSNKLHRYEVIKRMSLFTDCPAAQPKSFNPVRPRPRPASRFPRSLSQQLVY